MCFITILRAEMNTIRPCGCKGIRSCLQCEKQYNIDKLNAKTEFEKSIALSYCPACERLFPGWNTKEVCAQHSQHDGTHGIPFPGIYVLEEFLSGEEAIELMHKLDSMPWDISQSGRRKQNFGPKTNFKKRKLKNGLFNGFPEFSKFVQSRLCEIDLLSNYQAIEQCSLEYDPTKGASIDPHIDDCWIWGERVVTVNCLGDAVLTLTLYDAGYRDALLKTAKYNLELVQQYEDKLLLPLATDDDLLQFKDCTIRIPMPNRSLIVLYGPARYQFEHSVLREDVTERRVCIAYREFTPMYIDGGEKQKGEDVMKNAQNFWVYSENKNHKEIAL